MIVVHLKTIVVTERLFVKIAEQMERFNGNVGATKTALQKTPEVLKAVGVNSPSE